MISYLGVSVDELVQAFEASLAFTDDREGRSLEEPISFEETSEEDEDEESLEASESDEEAFDEEDEDEDLTDIFVDDSGLLHSYGPTVPAAAEYAIEFMTDYIIADDIDESWLTLDQARGALLALKIVLPTLEEIPEVECAYSFTIGRDEQTGLPNSVKMEPVSVEAAVESFTRSATAYEGVVKDSTILVNLFEANGVPQEEFEVLVDVMSEAIFALADEQCAIVLDVKAFVEALSAVKANPNRLELVDQDDSHTGHQH